MDALARAYTNRVTAAGRSTYYQPNLHKNLYATGNKAKLAPPEKANLVGSRLADGNHLPTLDLDVPATLIESSTEGHSHLFIDVELSQEKYFKLLDVLAECGIIESGYVQVSKLRGQSFVRRPGVYKEK